MPEMKSNWTCYKSRIYPGTMPPFHPGTCWVCSFSSMVAFVTNDWIPALVDDLAAHGAMSLASRLSVPHLNFWFSNTVPFPRPLLRRLNEYYHLIIFFNLSWVWFIDVPIYLFVCACAFLLIDWLIFLVRISPVQWDCVSNGCARIHLHPHFVPSLRFCVSSASFPLLDLKFVLVIIIIFLTLKCSFESEWFGCSFLCNAHGFGLDFFSVFFFVLVPVPSAMKIHLVFSLLKLDVWPERNQYSPPPPSLPSLPSLPHSTFLIKKRRRRMWI